MELHRSRVGIFLAALFMASGSAFLAYTFTTPDMSIVFKVMFGLVPAAIGVSGTYHVLPGPAHRDAGI